MKRLKSSASIEWNLVIEDSVLLTVRAGDDMRSVCQSIITREDLLKPFCCNCVWNFVCVDAEILIKLQSCHVFNNPESSGFTLCWNQLQIQTHDHRSQSNQTFFNWNALHGAFCGVFFLSVLFFFTQWGQKTRICKFIASSTVGCFHDGWTVWFSPDRSKQTNPPAASHFVGEREEQWNVLRKVNK